MKAGFHPVMFDPVTVRRQRFPVERDQPVEISSVDLNVGALMSGSGVVVEVDFAFTRESIPGVGISSALLVDEGGVRVTSGTLQPESIAELGKLVSGTDNAQASSAVLDAAEFIVGAPAIAEQYVASNDLALESLYVPSALGAGDVMITRGSVGLSEVLFISDAAMVAV